VAVDFAHVYWSNSEVNGSIGRADLNGQNVNQAFLTRLSNPRGLAVDSAHLFWAVGDLTGAIGRAGIDGQNANPAPSSPARSRPRESLSTRAEPAPAWGPELAHRRLGTG